MKFRKKPVIIEIEAVIWDETKDTFNKLVSMGMKCSSMSSHTVEDFVRNLYISTLEGPIHASKGDYIIKGIKGEFYPCKPDIFEQTYEPVEVAP